MTEKQYHFESTVPPELAGHRLDQAIAQLCPDHSRTLLQHWIKTGQLTVDGEKCRPRDKVREGQRIEIQAALTAQQTWEAEPIELDIVYEDDALIVINKPAGLVVHPGAGNPSQTLANALLHHDSDLAHLPRYGIVHRLDKDTTGLMVVARTLASHTALVKQIAQRAVKREYHTIVHGVFVSGGSINAPIGRHPTLRTKMAVIARGKEAITHYRILERFPHHTFVQVFLETGRTHQIRVHMTHIKHPIVGDRQYGGRLRLPPGCTPELRDMLQHFPRQALHAKRLTLTHPLTGETMSWETPIPSDMSLLLERLREIRV